MATPDFSELKTLLKQDLHALESLDELLQEERRALGANDMAAIETLNGRKHEILDGIRERAKQKVRQLVTAGFKPNDGAPSAFLEQLGDVELNDLWRTAHQAMAACQAKNGVNGQVIDHLQKRAGRLSEIIRGVSPGQKLYGARGREQAFSHKSVLANV